MQELIDYLDNKGIKYVIQYNKFGDSIVCLDDGHYEIGLFDNDSQFTIAAITTMNFIYLDFNELKKWLLRFI